MQARVDWVLIIFETQFIKKKRPVRFVFPDYLSVFYAYDYTFLFIFTPLPIEFFLLFSTIWKKVNLKIVLPIWTTSLETPW